MNPSWMLDERAHAGPEHLDEAFVAGYDRKQGYPDPSPDVRAFLDHGLGPESTVVDLAAGTGRFAAAAVQHFRRVIAVDVSPAMVAVLRRQIAEGLEAVQAGFLTFRWDGISVDGIHTRNALHQLPDFWKVQALLRMADALPPGGVLRISDLIYDFRPEQTGTVFQAWFEGAAADPAAGYTAEDYAEHIRTEHSTFRWLFEPMLDAAGFDIVSAGYSRSLYGTYTCLRR